MTFTVLPELIRQFGHVAEEAELAAAAQIGPLVSWGDQGLSGESSGQSRQ
jgi:hypothetical protein